MFILEELIGIFVNVGFEMLRCEYLYKKTVNQKEQSNVDRVFVQARFVLRNKL